MKEVFETIDMVEKENLDVRTITMGISLIDCADNDVAAACRKIEEKIKKHAGRLAATADGIAREFGFLYVIIAECRRICQTWILRDFVIY